MPADYLVESPPIGFLFRFRFRFFFHLLLSEVEKASKCGLLLEIGVIRAATRALPVTRGIGKDR